MSDIIETPVADLKADTRCQARECMDEQALKEYADAYRSGGALPPLDVFDVDDELVIVDGFHRHEAARRAGVLTLAVRVVGQGSMAEAEWHALASNQKHGLRRTRDDKRRAVRLALELDPGRSNREIARHLGVSNPFVGKIRNQDQAPHLPPEWFDANLIPAWAVVSADRYNDPDHRPDLGVAVTPLSPRYFVRLERLKFLGSLDIGVRETLWDEVGAALTLRDAELHAYEIIVYANSANIGVMEDLCAAMRREFEPEILAEMAMAKKHGLDVLTLRMASIVIRVVDSAPDAYGDLPKLGDVQAAYTELRRRCPEWSGVGRPWGDIFPPGFRDKETWRGYGEAAE